MKEKWFQRAQLPMAVIDQDGIVWTLREIGGPLYSHSISQQLRSPEDLEDQFGPCTPMVAEVEEGGE